MHVVQWCRVVMCSAERGHFLFCIASAARQTDATRNKAVSLEEKVSSTRLHALTIVWLWIEHVAIREPTFPHLKKSLNLIANP